MVEKDATQINRKVITSNLLWRFLERFGAYIVSFIISVVLARILDPSTYGIVALMTVVLAFLDVFVTGGCRYLAIIWQLFIFFSNRISSPWMVRGRNIGGFLSFLFFVWNRFMKVGWCDCLWARKIYTYWKQLKIVVFGELERYTLFKIRR